MRYAILSLALLAGAGIAAGAPPRPEEAGDLLRQEPISTATWARWSPRLREWSGEGFSRARPAFDRAFEFVLSVQKGGPAKRPTLPKELEKDAVAWTVLAGAFLQDSPRAASPVVAARAAGEAAREAVRRDATLARAHYYLCLALQGEQLAPPDKGGPTRPNPGRLQEALKALKQAYALDPNGGWMAPAEAGRLARAARQWDDAERFFRQALTAAPGDRDTTHLLAESIVEQGRPPKGGYAAGVEPLARQFPDDGVLASYLGRAFARDDKRDDAAAQFAQARKLGADPGTVVDPKLVREVEQGAERKAAEAERQRAEAGRRKAEADARDGAARDREAFFGRVLGIPLYFVLFYGLVMGCMCLAGVWLAKRTRGPQAAELLGDEPGEMTAGGRVVRTAHETRLARFYAVVLAAALVLFYLSLPFVFVGMLVVFLALILLALLTRRRAAEGDVHGALLKASGGGIGALFKATFARTGTGGYGKEKDREDCPRLFAAIDEVAGRVDTSPPDEVYISPGADFGVHQEGYGPFGVFGKRKRVLTLGLCVLHFLTVDELKAILAHEFAHFSHADTHWNRFLFQVTLSLRTALAEMARTGGLVTYVNPFYWFFWLYSKSYNILSAGFSRSREFLADRMACSLYGSDVFTSGLRKVCTDGSLFEMTIYRNIVRLLKEKKAFVNMYLAFRKYREESLTESERRKLNKRLLEDRSSLFASHPSFHERVEAAGHLPAAARPDGALALTLFENAEAVEQELTDFLTQLVDRYMQV